MNEDVWNTLWEGLDDFEARIEGNRLAQFYTKAEYLGALHEIENARAYLQEQRGHDD